MNTFLVGDVITMLKTLPSESVNCCVTSPPYWGLRDYGVEGQLGAERTPEEYVQRMAAVFAEVKRVLRDNGTLWLNLGDGYDGYWGDSKARKEGRPSNADVNGWTNGFNMNARPNFHEAFDAIKVKPKDLIGIPWLTAFALRADGWYLRQEIIWHKPNAMPESVKDRPTRAHEQIFLLSKSQRYYYDGDAVKEPIAESSKKRIAQPTFDQQTGGDKDYRNGVNANRSMRKTLENLKENGNGSRNKRSVWTIPTKPFKGAHFAVFPPDLVRPCILAGCPIGGVVLDPFGGSGTVAMVAAELGRDSIYIDLNPKYAEMAKQRAGVFGTYQQELS